MFFVHYFLYETVRLKEKAIELCKSDSPKDYMEYIRLRGDLHVESCDTYYSAMTFKNRLSITCEFYNLSNSDGGILEHSEESLKEYNNYRSAEQGVQAVIWLSDIFKRIAREMCN